MENSDYRDMVLRIYEAVSDASLWPGVIDRITELTASRGCIVFEWQMRDGARRLEAPIISSTYRRHVVEDYISRFHKWEARDHEMFDRALLPVDGIDVMSEEILYDSEDDYLDRPHVRALREHGIRYRTGALLDKDNPFRARFSLAMSESRGPFDETELQLLRDLLPHVAKALELSRPVGLGWGERQALLAIIDRLAVGICLVDRDGNLVVSNGEFDRQREAYGAFRIDPRGRLALNDRADRRQFARLLSDVLAHGACGARPRKEAVVFDTGEEGGALCIEIVPLERAGETGSKPFQGALVISRDTCQPIAIDLDLARDVFGLTTAEASVIDLVCEGLTNSEIARRRERSVETINAQMKTILGKTRAINRTQLVRLLCNFSLPRALVAR